jgi:hypothetical protein
MFFNVEGGGVSLFMKTYEQACMNIIRDKFNQFHIKLFAKLYKKKLGSDRIRLHITR